MHERLPQKKIQVYIQLKITMSCKIKKLLNEFYNKSCKLDMKVIRRFLIISH